jgi:hypothetical protein
MAVMGYDAHPGPALPHDVARCGGMQPHADAQCTRRTGCARYLARSSPSSPFEVSCCETGDRYIHAGSVVTPSTAGNPQDATPARVLARNTAGIVDAT